MNQQIPVICYAVIVSFTFTHQAICVINIKSACEFRGWSINQSQNKCYHSKKISISSVCSYGAT